MPFARGDNVPLAIFEFHHTIGTGKLEFLVKIGPLDINAGDLGHRTRVFCLDRLVDSSLDLLCGRLSVVTTASKKDAESDSARLFREEGCQHLLRNSCHFRLLRSEMEAKSGGLFLEAAEKVVLVFFFVIAFAGVAVSLAVFEHPANDSGQLVRDRFDRLGRIEPGAQAATEGPQGAFAFEDGGRLVAWGAWGRSLTPWGAWGRSLTLDDSFEVHGKLVVWRN